MSPSEIEITIATIVLIGIIIAIVWAIIGVIIGFLGVYFHDYSGKSQS